MTPLTLQFGSTDVVANATTDCVLTHGSSGFEIPSGYDFYPTIMSISASEALTAGTITGKVTSNGTAITSGPEPALSTSDQYNATEITPSPSVAASARVGCEIVASSGLTPATIDIDIMIVGILLPAEI